MAALQRYARPEEVASFVAYLASAEAGFIPGAGLLVDGGYSCLTFKKSSNHREDTRGYRGTARFPSCGKLAAVWFYTSRMSFGKEILLNDVRYSGWANHCLLEACAVLTGEELERDLRISHANILATFRHIYDGERVWLDRLRASAETEMYRLPTGPAPELSLDELRQKWPELWEGYIRWLSGVNESDLGMARTTQVPGGAEPCVSCWRILRHVLEHSTLHRGQVVGMIRTLGRTPPAIHRMDYYLVVEPMAAPRTGA